MNKLKGLKKKAYLALQRVRGYRGYVKALEARYGGRWEAVRALAHNGGLLGTAKGLAYTEATPEVVAEGKEVREWLKAFPELLQRPLLEIDYEEWEASGMYPAGYRQILYSYVPFHGGALYYIVEKVEYEDEEYPRIREYIAVGEETSCLLLLFY